MSAEHFTVHAASEGLVEIKGSKFICCLMPYADFESALALARQQHAKASHVVPVFRHMGDDGCTVHEGSSDDGEPSGTAGRPAFAVVQGAKLVNVGLYIVRYFGGTKLGTGPLARAYGASARDAIAQATLAPWEPHRELIVPVPYDAVPKIELEIRQMPFGTSLERQHRADGVDYVFQGTKSLIDQIEAKLVLARLCAGH